MGFPTKDICNLKQFSQFLLHISFFALLVKYGGYIMTGNTKKKNCNKNKKLRINFIGHTGFPKIRK